MIKELYIALDSRSGHNGNVNGGLFGYESEIYVSNLDFIDSFYLTVNEYRWVPGYLGSQSTEKEGVLRINMEKFNPQHDWVLKEVYHSKQQLGQDYTSWHTILGNFTVYPVALQRWLENHFYAATSFRWELPPLENIALPLYEAIFEYEQRISGSYDLLRGANIVARKLKLKEAPRRKNLDKPSSWRYAKMQVVIVLRELARKAGLLKEFDERVSWREKPEFFDYKKFPVAPVDIPQKKIKL